MIVDVKCKVCGTEQNIAVPDGHTDPVRWECGAPGLNGEPSCATVHLIPGSTDPVARARADAERAEHMHALVAGGTLTPEAIATLADAGHIDPSVVDALRATGALPPAPDNAVTADTTAGATTTAQVNR